MWEVIYFLLCAYTLVFIPSLKVPINHEDRALVVKKEVSVAVEKNECRGWWYARDGTIEEVEPWHVSLGSDPICKERDAGVQPDQTLYEPDNMEEELRFSIR